MGKSFKKNIDFYDDYEEMETMKGHGHGHGYKKSKPRVDDKKLEIQRARKNAQAERDRASKEFMDVD